MVLRDGSIACMGRHIVFSVVYPCWVSTVQSTRGGCTDVLSLIFCNKGHCQACEAFSRVAATMAIQQGGCCVAHPLFHHVEEGRADTFHPRHRHPRLGSVSLVVMSSPLMLKPNTCTWSIQVRARCIAGVPMSFNVKWPPEWREEGLNPLPEGGEERMNPNGWRRGYWRENGSVLVIYIGRSG